MARRIWGQNSIVKYIVCLCGREIVLMLIQELLGHAIIAVCLTDNVRCLADGFQ
jgi:hypothetical protein